MANIKNDKKILNNFGGIFKNNLSNVMGENDDENTIVISDSHYVTVDEMPKYVQSYVEGFSVLSINMQSIGSDGKLDTFKCILSDLESKGVKFSAICIQESWITKPKDNAKENDLLKMFDIPGYYMTPLYATCSSHGGLLTYIRHEYKATILNLYSPSKIWEGQFFKINGGNLDRTLNLCNLYKPPLQNNSNSNIQTFLEEFSPKFDTIAKSNTDVIVVGDLNIDLLQMKERSKFSEYFDLFLGNGLLPQINIPTRFSRKNATLIDHIFSKFKHDPVNRKSKSGILFTKISDHLPTFYFHKTTTHKKQYHPKYVLQQTNNENAIKSFNTAIMNAKIMDNLDTSVNACPDKNYDILENVLIKLKDTHLPVKKVKYNKYKHKDSSWITQGILNSIKFRDNLYKELQCTSPEDPHYTTMKHNLHVYNGILRKSIRKTKLSYYNDLFDKFKDDIKKTWDTIKSVMSRTKNKRHIPNCLVVDGNEIKDKITIAEKFNDFFINVGPNLADSINTKDKKDFTSYLTQKIEHKFNFECVTVDDISKILNKFESKTSTGHDNLSMKVFKRIAPSIFEPLTCIINQSLSLGIFPRSLKIAKVIPLFKKDNDKILDNYRPISLLPVISKVFEKCVFNQLYEYFKKHKLFYTSQYGFRKAHSTELACLELVDRIFKELDRGELPIAIFIDLSKAFDTLDHRILLAKLKYYGIQETSLKWFTSYLSNRTQYVQIDDTSSQKKNIKTGVPQGSILGPLLFIIYMNDIQHASAVFDSILYADDTNLISPMSVFSTHSGDIRLTSDNINLELIKISDWMAVNKLSLNIGKTKFMIFHYPQRKLTQENIPHVKINEITINQTNEFNFLGLTISETLQWNAHINKVSNKISKTIGVMYRIKKFVNQSILKLIYNALIVPHLNYSLLCWGFSINRLIKLQKKAVRVICMSTYNAHTNPLFKSLNLLKVTDIFKINTLKFVYKYRKGTLPNYFHGMLDDIHVETNHNHNTRHQNTHTPLPPRPNRSTTNNSLRYFAPRLIEDTPDCITDKLSTHSLDGVKRYVKRYFIDDYKIQCLIPNCYICRRRVVA